MFQITIENFFQSSTLSLSIQFKKDLLLYVLKYNYTSMDEPEEKGEVQEEVTAGRPSWRVQVEYSNHTTQDIVGYDDYLPD